MLRSTVALPVVLLSKQISSPRSSHYLEDVKVGERNTQKRPTQRKLQETRQVCCPSQRAGKTKQNKAKQDVNSARNAARLFQVRIGLSNLCEDVKRDINLFCMGTVIET